MATMEVLFMPRLRLPLSSVGNRYCFGSCIFYGSGLGNQDVIRK